MVVAGSVDFGGPVSMERCRFLVRLQDIENGHHSLGLCMQ